MTRKEAIERIKDHMEVHHIGEYPHIKLKEALDMALSALRPVTQGQVEKAWGGEWERIVDPYGKTEGFLCKCGRQSNSADDFCPSCGKAMSKKAIDIVTERMKELGSNND